MTIHKHLLILQRLSVFVFHTYEYIFLRDLCSLIYDTCSEDVYRYWKSTKCESPLDHMRWNKDYGLQKFGQLEFFREYLELGNSLP